MRVRVPLSLLILAMLAAAPVGTPAGAAAPVPPAARLAAVQPRAATCWYGACYNYVTGRQNVRATGASVRMYQARPVLDPADSSAHSLQELAVMSADHASIVEVGWIVDPRINGDSAPHLFVYHWVNGKTSCYNGCGFVPVSKSVRPGIPVSAGEANGYAILFYAGNWWIQYGSTWIGYFPGSLWGNAFTAYDTVQVFGEVSSTGTTSCSDMGNGGYGSQPDSSWISSYAVQGTTVAPSLTVSATTPTLYDQGSMTATSYHLGGPGTGSC
jgi:hypothetical protein